MSAEVRYVKYAGGEPCWGCSRRLQEWHESDRSGPMPPRAAVAKWKRIRVGQEGFWPLCYADKQQWEVHDVQARRTR